MAESRSHSLPSIFFTAAAAFSIGLLTYGLYLTLAVVSLQTDSAQISKRIAEGFSKGVLTDDDYPEDASHTHNQFNDCLVLFQATSRSASTLQLAVSPQTIRYGRGQCKTLHSVVTDRNSRTEISPYHNYVFGQTTLARLALSIISLKQTEHIWKLAIVLSLFLGAAVCMVDIVKSSETSGPIALLVVLFVFMSWYGLGSFGQSVSHSPSDLVLIGFIVFLALGRFSGGIWPEAAIAACALFGALTMIFELLTGGLPLGLCVIVGLLPLALRGDISIKHSVARAVLSFCAAATACVLAKIFLVASFFGPQSLMYAGHQLGVRIGLAKSTTDASAPNLFALLKSLKANMAALYAGQREMATVLLLVAVIAGAWAMYSARSEESAQSRTTIYFLGGSNLILIAWIGAFSEHTFVHAFFMDRILAWPIASGLAMFALAAIKHTKMKSKDDAVKNGYGYELDPADPIRPLPCPICNMPLRPMDVYRSSRENGVLRCQHIRNTAYE